MPEVRILSGPESGRAVILERGSTLRIGRKLPPAPAGAPVSDIEVDDAKLSRLHCEVLDVDGAWVLRDCGSSNGTFLNGKRVHERVLRPGDRVQLGATELELSALEGEDSREDDHATRVPPPARPRRTARRSTPWPAIAGIGGAAGIAILLVVRSRGAPDPEVSTSAPAKAPAKKIPDPAAASGRGEPAASGQGEPGADRAEVAESAPAAGREAPAPAREAVLAHVARGEYREALEFLEDLELRGGGFDLEPLRLDLRARALEDLESAAAEAERETAAGRGGPERARLEKVAGALPADLMAQGDAAMERIVSLSTGAAEARNRAEPAGDPGIRASLEEIAASVKRLEGSKDADAAAWEGICSRIARVVAESRARPGRDAHRRAARALFLKAKTAALDRPDISQLFSAKRASRRGSDLRLEYTFESKAVPADLRGAPGCSLEVAGKALILQGVCRLLDGEPFEGALTVRVKLPAGGYSGAAPNIGIAVFTSAKDVLVVPGRTPTSLLGFVGSAPGKEPRDWALFALGYKAPVLSYGDESIEKVYVTGLTDPLDLPANAVIFGRAGKPLHTDSRECPWAVKSAPYSGPLTIEVAAGPKAVSWKVNGKEIVGGPGPVLDRWLVGAPRIGSVTVFASGGPVKIAGLEVEGPLRELWLDRRLEQAAARAYEAIDPE